MAENDTITTKEAAGVVAILAPLAYLLGRKIGRHKTLRQVKKLNKS